jgi:ATP-dependent DNA ligase
MSLPLKPPLSPMEAEAVETIPTGDQWQYEPKWDGFRCLVFRDGAKVHLQSKSCQSLGRYFPELVEQALRLPARRFVLDGELVVPGAGKLSFDDLLMRIHPAESRVRKLAAEHPAVLIVFDLLADERGRSLADLPLEDRRERLERFAARYFAASGAIRLSPATTDLALARKWFRSKSADLDGIVAKHLDRPYLGGQREGMQKIKHRRTADCVVGGFRYAEGSRRVGSLLLGLYDRKGLLHHVGFAASFTQADRDRITKLVQPLIAPPGFTGRAPGGPSRWSTKRSSQWQPLQPKLVVEVQYDHFTGGRFRHGTKLLRWRPDKSPRSCLLDQVTRRGGANLKLLEKMPA